MKPHYFDRPEADPRDHQLGMAKMAGYVPQTCLLGGVTVMAEVAAGRNPCWGCEGPRERCHGKPRCTCAEPHDRPYWTCPAHGNVVVDP